jgi:hypothetical protein
MNQKYRGIVRMTTVERTVTAESSLFSVLNLFLAVIIPNPPVGR